MQKITSKKSLRTIVLLVALALNLSAAMPTLAGAASKYIGLAKAKSIALEDAGQSEDTVRFVKAVRYQKGRYGVRYKLIFLSANTKYRYELDAKTGDILISNQYDLRGGKTEAASGETTTSFGSNSVSEKLTAIGKSKAKDIALKHAKAEAKHIRNLDVDLKDKKKYPYYEVEFEYKGYNYEYEIDALDGEILTWERERS